MAGNTRNGRKNPSGRFINTIKMSSAEQGMLKNQDAIIDALKALTAKLDADAGITDTNYASTVTDVLAKLKLQEGGS